MMITCKRDILETSLCAASIPCHVHTHRHHVTLYAGDTKGKSINEELVEEGLARVVVR